MRRTYRRQGQTAPQGAGPTIAATATVAVLAISLFCIARPARGVARASTLPPAATLLVDLHSHLPRAQLGDWRDGPGRDERGQSYEQWKASDPRTARGRRKTLYIVVLGGLDEERRQIVEHTITFLGLYFGIAVERLEPVAIDDDWPAAQRRAMSDGSTQLRTQHILRRVLAPRLPDDAAALLALTAHDLWPGAGWNFVFGMASLRERVGVWSIARFGDPGRSEASRIRCLRRTLKVATHETGHMFGMEHCLAFACNMCGSNTLDETDRHPLWLCPECLPKLWDATGVHPAKRFARLAAFARDAGLHAEAAFYAASRDRLTKP